MRKKYFLWAGFFFLLLVFSLWLMWHTLSYDSANHSLLIASKYWSDFGQALPLIRSFSFGTNWPLQHPLYPGEPIRYHFLFYALVGLLEKVGLRLDFSLNLPSAFGFFSLCLLIFAVAKRIFVRTGTAVLSVIFFLFNGSLSFMDFFQNHPLSRLSPGQIAANSVFPSFGPWNGSSIAAFWNLNIYTNQRHLGLSFALVLVIIYLLCTGRKPLIYFAGLFTGLLLLFNQAAFAVSLPFIVVYFIFRPALRRPLLLSFLGFLPWAAFALLFTHPGSVVSLKPAFLLNHTLTPVSFLHYWFNNFGLHLVLIPLGMLFAPRRSRLLVLPLLSLFVIPNVFQLSVDMINNHKFFNFFLIVGNMFSAFVLVSLWSNFRFFGKAIASLLFLFLTFGGIIDFFPVKNDSRLSLSDYPANPDVAFFLNHTSSRATVLNSTWFYHPASLAGRPIFNGYSYFTWSYGYDQTLRESQTLSIYQAPDVSTACRLLKRFNISYVELNSHPENFLHPHWSLWTDYFPAVYSNPLTGLTVYSVRPTCP